MKRARDFGQTFNVTTRAKLGTGNKLQYTAGGEAKVLKSSKDFVALNFSELKAGSALTVESLSNYIGETMELG